MLNRAERSVPALVVSIKQDCKTLTRLVLEMISCLGSVISAAPGFRRPFFPESWAIPLTRDGGSIFSAIFFLQSALSDLFTLSHIVTEF